MAFKVKKCNHLKVINEVKKSTSYQCEECIKTGDDWVHLRTCQTCGVTLCCDSSPNKHARQHAIAENHPVIGSAEPNERWLWCYIDELISKY
ncbi:UBP-type zinc finger domain-containing protein [Galbibacter mesophilus]|uniref:UBP-type zinc finger domain-containing protein n=1 Tax=Galbibacter mesophilus TaxID=379069 RepID=UPI00191EC035|nr:UBP-type zinc finger domain-containing protein [Galbibacter mesophilus]MCM5663461.1 UBP-type zinc finger domain-containing protein [Galbibacter mesophilus]